MDAYGSVGVAELGGSAPEDAVVEFALTASDVVLAFAEELGNRLYVCASVAANHPTKKKTTAKTTPPKVFTIKGAPLFLRVCVRDLALIIKV